MSATDTTGLQDELVERAFALLRRMAGKESWQSHYGYRWEDEAGDILAALSARPPKVDAIPKGMVPWAGGDSAPTDWGGGPVLFRNRKISVQSPVWRWKWEDPPYTHDIIAYTPTPINDTTYAGSEVPRDRFANDAAAKIIYDSWSGVEGWVPWVERGNSDKQEEARAALAKDSTS